ncbi:MAG: hypothetical protein AAFX78_01980 [Cyanobacteria bacterium J06638_20]
MVSLNRPIQLLATGSRPDKYGREFSFSSKDLEAMAAQFSGAPLVVGHPADDSPEFGKGTKVEVRGGRLVLTEADKLNPVFQQIVNTGELSGVSLKLRQPWHPQNKTGAYLIRHIGFLGKTQPAWNELEPAAFSAEEPSDLLFAVFEGEEPVGKQTPETNDPVTDNRDAEFAQREADLAQKEAEFAAKHQRLVRREEVRPELLTLQQQGKVLPAEVAPLEALFAELDPNLEIEFAQAGGETGKVKAAKWLRTFLGTLPARVSYDEQTAEEEAEFSARHEGDKDPATARRKAAQKTLNAARK